MRANAVAALAVAATATLLAGCGGKAKQTTTSTTATVAQPSAAVAQIKPNWAQFFDGSTSAADRIKLLENGPKFASLINAINSSPLAKQVKAIVGHVVLTSSTQARVTYSLELSGQPVLTNVNGTAIFAGGMWKVGVASFCRLVKLQGVVPTACK